MTETLLDELETHLRQALTYNENAEVAPVALLWPDRARQFETAIAHLRERLPVLSLGEFDVDAGCGPAYWLRCAVAGTVGVDLPEGVPVLYLPGFAREDLRAIENCPREIAPIAELQYRGQWFSHPNGRDWTIRGFLSNDERALGLSVADDADTGELLNDALDRLLNQPMRRLASQHIDADFLRQLLNPDPVARLLEWLDDPANFRSRIDDAEWRAFVGLCRDQYDFNPETDGEVIGGRRLGEQQGPWAQVWQRFEDTPERYSGVEQRLRMGKPTDRLFAGPEGAWPQNNEEAEDKLRAALQKLDNASPGQARSAVGQLWQAHRDRRGWVWAKLDRAPLVFALEQLQRLAELTAAPPTGDVAALVDAYTKHGWRADNAFVAALRAAPETADRRAVAAAARAMYRPWLDATARALQDAIGPMPHSPTYCPGPEASTEGGTVTLFVDGLRFDLAHRLAERLGGHDVEVDTSLAALPTVTATAKAALTPVPEGTLVGGDGLGPARASSGAKANITVLRSLMSERGVQILQGMDTGDPTGTAWTEIGDIDKRGHDFGVAFVDELDRELDDIAKRVDVLLDAGWERVDVVSDHGWLLMPGGLEKVELSAAAVALKKGRCARVKDGAAVSVPTVPWHWDQDVRIALAPGASCFEANKEYEHGGVSLQECVVPRLRVRAASDRATTGGATITHVKWLGLMCRVRFENVARGASVDIRALPADPTTSVAQTVKETTGAGKQSLHVPDEDLEGERAYVVIVADDGRILAQRDVAIGQNR